jgi:hypothetical protein
VIALTTALLANGTLAQSRTAADELAERNAIFDAAYWAFARADFAALERMHREYSLGAPRLSDGTRKVDRFRDGLQRVLDGPRNATDTYFQEVTRLTRQWADAHRESAFAQVLHARAVLAHGWFYRGTGLSSTVPPDAWPRFQARAEDALRFLAERADVAFTDSWGHHAAVSVGRAVGFEIGRIDAIAREGLKLDPEDDLLRYAALYSRLPKWGGDARVVDQFIEETVAQTQAIEGQAWYARLYAFAGLEQYSHRLFEDSRANWSKVKQGWEDRLRRFPSFRTLNTYAYMSCIARDRDTFRQAMSRIGDQVIPDLWTPNAARTLDTCQAWANQQ